MYRVYVIAKESRISYRNPSIPRRVPHYITICWSIEDTKEEAEKMAKKLNGFTDYQAVDFSKPFKKNSAM